MELSIFERKKVVTLCPQFKIHRIINLKFKNRNLLNAWTTKYTVNEKTSHTNVLTCSNNILTVKNFRMKKRTKNNKLQSRKNDIFRVACDIVVEEKPVDAATWYYLFFEYYAEKGKKNQPSQRFSLVSIEYRTPGSDSSMKQITHFARFYHESRLFKKQSTVFAETNAPGA